MHDALLDEPTLTDVSPSQPKVRADGALALLCVAQLMLILDFSIVNVALPSIKVALGFTESGLQWVISGYALTFGGLLMLGGRAADLFGRRRVFVAGMALFSVASLLGGFAKTSWVLIAARALQGVGGAIVSPASLSLVTTIFPEGPERNRAMGWLGTMSTVGFGVGMMVGGLLTDSVGWEWVMFINVPIGVAVIGLARAILPGDRATSPVVGFDLAGAGLITLTSAAFVYALSDADRAGWGSRQTLGLLAIGGALLIAFILVESRVKHPLVPLSIFRRRNLVGANLVGFFLAAAVPAMIYLLTLHMQQDLGYSPWTTGLAFLPHAVVAFIAARLIPKIVNRFGPRPVMAWGGAIFGGSVLLLAAMTPHGSYMSELLPGLMITPIGILFGFIASMIVATSGMPNEEQGLASGLLSTCQQIGQALGLAVILNVVAAGQARGIMLGMDATAARVVGFRHGFLVEAGFAAMSVTMALLVVRKTAGGPAVVGPMH